jgi:hypothetical protein
MLLRSGKIKQTLAAAPQVAPQVEQAVESSGSASSSKPPAAASHNVKACRDSKCGFEHAYFCSKHKRFHELSAFSCFASGKVKMQCSRMLNSAKKTMNRPGVAERNRINMRENISPINNPRRTKEQLVRTKEQLVRNKDRVRKRQVERSIEEKDLPPVERSHAETLLQPHKHRALKSFVDKHSDKTLRRLMNGDIKDIVGLDSACSKSRWNKGKNASKSWQGNDMFAFTAYSVLEQEWLTMTRSDGDEKRNGVNWLVRRWDKDSWSNTVAVDENPGVTYNERLDEKAAQALFIEWVGDALIIDYNGIDKSRINSWLEILGNAPLPFFDLCRGVCMSTGRTKKIFGCEDSAIVYSIDAKLHTITDDLFVLGGKSHMAPKPNSPAHEKKLSPHLTEVIVMIKWSDEPLDVQRLINLFFLLREIYQMPVFNIVAV